MKYCSWTELYVLKQANPDLKKEILWVKKGRREAALLLPAHQR